MGNPSQGYRTIRRWARELVPALGLAGLLFGSAAVAWKLLTRPAPKAAPIVVDVDRNARPYLSVAAAAVDLELIAPDGRRAVTASSLELASRVPLSDAGVDCGGYGREKESESACTASIVVHEPMHGTWRVIVTSTDSTRGETLNIGFGGQGFRRSGGFPVRLMVDAHQSVEFTIGVMPEGVSQTSRVNPKAR
ncbi:MAG: hypothetical protein NTZ43_09110 [Gemmatimonadetes bacterium]|nr:hypothetical protein [Gemmatimonadota bacterium]